MPSLITKSLRIANAKAIKESLIRVDPEPDNLYIAFGREAVWDNENTPDTPTTSVNDEFTARDGLVGMKKLTEFNVAHVIPRIDWESGTVYDQYDPDVELGETDFYVLTSNYGVFKCIDNNGGGTSVVEPTGTNVTEISTGDGYTWKFMFDLSSTMQANFLTTAWLPVPTGSQRTASQIAVEDNAVYTTGDPVGGHGSDAVEELFAVNMMFSRTFSGSESGVLPIDDDFRQIVLWLNPRLISDGELATGSVYSVNDSNSDIDSGSGKILYIENRRAISRAADQAEDIKFILKF